MLIVWCNQGGGTAPRRRRRSPLRSSRLPPRRDLRVVRRRPFGLTYSMRPGVSSIMAVHAFEHEPCVSVHLSCASAFQVDVCARLYMHLDIFLVIQFRMLTLF